MKRFIFYNLLIIIALATGCNKVELDPVDGDPVFTASFDLAGTSHEWLAGVDDYYMFSSFEKDAQDVYEFSGSFAKKDSIGGETLTFHIRDYQQVFQGLPNVDETFLTNTNFAFASMSGTDTIWQQQVDTLGWSVVFDASASIIPNSPVAYIWSYGDNTSFSSDLQTSAHFYTQLPSQPVTLTVSTPSCSASVTKQLNVLGSNTSCELDFDISLPNPSDSGIVVQASLVNGLAPFSYVWSDSSTADSLWIQSNFGPVSASVTVTDAAGCTVSGSISTMLVQGIFPPLCVAKFSNSPAIPDTATTLVIDTIIVGDMLQFSRVKVEYTDLSGRFFSSFFQSQPSSSFLKILDVEDYDDNEKGEKTKKLTLEYACRLWDEQGNHIDIENGKAVIAVAYP